MTVGLLVAGQHHHLIHLVAFGLIQLELAVRAAGHVLKGFAGQRLSDLGAVRGASVDLHRHAFHGCGAVVAHDDFQTHLAGGHHRESGFHYLCIGNGGDGGGIVRSIPVIFGGDGQGIGVLCGKIGRKDHQTLVAVAVAQGQAGFGACGDLCAGFIGQQVVIAREHILAQIGDLGGQPQSAAAHQVALIEIELRYRCIHA